MLKSVFQLMVGNSAAQFIQFASIPILTRLYSPKDFGFLAIAIAISGVLGVIATLQLNVAVVSLKSKIAVTRLLSSAFLLNLIMIATSTILTYLIGYIFYNGVISNTLILLIVAITFFSSINNILKGVFVYFGSFASLSKTYFFRSVTIVILQFTFVQISIHNGLILGLLAGEVIMFIIILFFQLKLSSKLFSLSNRSLPRLWLLLKKQKAFTIYGTLQELISVGVFWLPLIVITYLFGSGVGGQYSISARMLWPVTVLVTGSIAQVLYHRLANKPKLDLEKEFYFSHYFKISYIPMAIIAYNITPIAFEITLDKSWNDAIELSKYVAILCLLFLYILPYRVMFRVLKLQKKQLIIELLIALVMILFFSMVDIFDIDLILQLIIFFMLVQVVIQEVVVRKYLRSQLMEGLR